MENTLELTQRTSHYLESLRGTYTNRSDLHKACTKILAWRKAKKKRHPRAKKQVCEKKGRPRACPEHYYAMYRSRYKMGITAIAELLSISTVEVHKLHCKGILKHRIKLERLK